MTQPAAISGPPALAVPAHRFTQGGRYVYSFPLDLPTLDRLMPDRVDERIRQAEGANRPLTLSHAKKIQEYLERENKWLFGTLLLGISPDDVEFQPLQDTNRAIVAGMLRILSTSDIKIFDGQHRRRAIKDALESLSQNRHKQDKFATLQGESVPVMLYAESSIDALRQMFADAAQTRTIETNTVARFDWRDAFNRAAEQLGEISDFLGGRIERERPTVARSSPNIIAINQLAATLKAVEVGIKGRVSQELNNHYLISVDELVDRCWAWSDEFMPAAREEYDNLLSGDLDNSEIPEMRPHTMAFNATVIRILAGCYHEWTKGSADWKPLADYIRSASLKPGAVNGTLLVESGVVLPGGITPVGRQKEVVGAVDYIVRQARAAVN